MQKTSSRLLTLLSLLQARRDWPGAVLADRLDVSSRTVRRDVDRLRDLGYPIATVKGPDGGYRLEAGKDLPPLLFDDDQAVALAIALQLATTNGSGTEDAAVRALQTIRQVMPSRLRARIDAVSVTSVQDSTGVDASTLTAIGAAIHACETLRFDYGRDDRPPRRAEPHHLITRHGRWYLIAWDLDVADWRTFRVDRMGMRTPNGPRFTPRELPGSDVATFVTGRFRGTTGATADWPCVGTAVVDRPLRQVAPFVVDGTAVDHGDGRTRVELGSWSWTALAARFGGFDAALEVLGPPELSDAARVLARRYAEAGARST